MTRDHARDDLDRLLAGDPEMPQQLGAVLRAAAAEFDETPAAEVRERHLSAMRATAPSPNPAPARGSQWNRGRGSQWNRASLGAWARRARLALGLTAGKLALGVGMAAAATGGLAATGNLPDPAQRVVADVAEQIGLDLPRPSEAPATTPGSPSGDDAPRGGGTGRPTELPSQARTTPPGRDAGDGRPGRGDAPPADGHATEHATPGRPDDAGRPSDRPAGEHSRSSEAPGAEHRPEDRGGGAFATPPVPAGRVGAGAGAQRHAQTSTGSESGSDTD